MQTKYLSCREISEITGMTTRTVWNWIRNGLIPATCPGGRDYMIKESDFLEFMERGAIKPQKSKTEEETA